MPFNHIPLNKPYLGKAEEAAVLQALRNAQLVGNGPVGKAVEHYMAELFRVKYVLLTTSCTHAMELALMAIGVGPGDEVIMPSFTFTSTATAVIRQGGIPVFVDIEETTYNIDPTLIEDAVTRRTRAIMPVHYAGQGCRMDEIMRLAERYGLYVIEDAAQGVGAKYQARYLGTWGHIGCYSFHATKNVTCGEGGAFLTDDDNLAHKAEITREKGTNRAQFLRGEVDKYVWVDAGSSFVLSDVLAAILFEQLKKMPEVLEKRKVIWHRYHNELADLEQAGKLARPYVDPNTELNWHIYAIRVPLEKLNRWLSELKSRGIGATFHYVPLHSSPFGRKEWGYQADDLPVTEQVSRSLIRLPIFPGLTDAEQEYIIQSLHAIAKEV